MSYAYKRAITLGAATGSTQTDFPVLVKFDSSNVGTTFKIAGSGGHIQNTVTQSGGNAVEMPADLIITSDSAGTTNIPWEIESYDKTNGILWLWAKIASYTTGTNTIYVFYGDLAVTTQQNTSSFAPSAVWNSAFKGVWHLPDGTTLSKLDSTSNVNDLSNFGSPTPAAGTGQIDGALSLSGSTGYIGKTSPSNLPTGATARTVEAWTKVNSLAAGNTVVQFGNTGVTRQTFLLYTTGNTFQVGTWADDLVSPTTLSTGTWYHVAVTYDGSTTLKLYLNGALDTTYTLGGSLNTTLDVNGISLGAWPGASAHYMNGIIDEGRVSNIERSANWLATGYANQNAPLSFNSIGSETSLTVTVINQVMLGAQLDIRISNNYMMV